jgi:hypothetical protein
MKSTYRFFHDRSKTDADELTLIVVSLIDKRFVLADEKGFFSRVVQWIIDILLTTIDTTLGNYFRCPKNIFTQLT